MAFLVIIPALHLVLMAVWDSFRCVATGGDSGSLVQHARRMVDARRVRTGALLFMTEGSALIGFDIEPGLYAILVSLVVYYVTLMIGAMSSGV